MDLPRDVIIPLISDVEKAADKIEYPAQAKLMELVCQSLDNPSVVTTLPVQVC
jgi:hypothetical protein